MSLPGSKTQRWCWPERLQTTATTGYTRLWGMSPQTSLLAKRRMGINEEQNYSEKDAKNGTKTRGSDYRVLTLDAAHDFGSLFLGENVRHGVIRQR